MLFRTPNCVYAVSTDEHNETGDLDEALKIEIKWLKKEIENYKR